MANKKREVYKPKPMTEGKKAVIQGLLDEYDINTAEDIQDALKDLLSGTIQSMLEAEMNEHLGYEKYARDDEPNYRNGTKKKNIRSKYGEFQIDVPQDRDSTYNQLVTEKKEIIANAELIRKTLCLTDALQEEKAKLEEEIAVVVEMTQNIVAENARIVQDQSEYQKRYDGLVQHYDEAKARYDEVAAAISAKEAKSERLANFIKEL